MYKTNIKIKLLSPLLHFGDDRLGTMQVLRTQKFLINNEVLDIPVFSGNALRGILRRLIMDDFLKRIDVYDEGISAKLYYMLYSGGALTGGSRYEEVGNKQIMRKKCPPLSLLGTAINDQILQGKMKVSIMKPLCLELNDYNLEQTDISIYDLLEDVFYTRRDDLKTKGDDLINDETKHKNPVQMKYEMQCLATGTQLVGNISLEFENKVETSCLIAMLDLLKNKPFIGGKSATGHGEISLKYDKDISSDIYYNYLEDNKDSIVEWLRNTEKELK